MCERSLVFFFIVFFRPFFSGATGGLSLDRRTWRDRWWFFLLICLPVRWGEDENKLRKWDENKLGEVGRKLTDEDYQLRH